MKKQHIYLLFLVILSWQSCSKAPNCGDLSDIVNNYSISADDKSKIPFKGTDTLVYISNAGDTATLIGTGKRAFIYEIRRKKSGNADCPKNQIDNKETINIEYNGNNTELNKIQYKISGEKVETEIAFIINSSGVIADTYYLNNPTFYTDSVSIENKFYIGRPIVWLNVNSLLYNYNYGFLKIQLNGGKIWVLKI